VGNVILIYAPLRARYVTCDSAQTNVLGTIYLVLITKDIVPVWYNYLLAVNTVQLFKHSLLEPEGSSRKQQKPRPWLPILTNKLPGCIYICPSIPCSVLGLQLCSIYVKFVVSDIVCKSSITRVETARNYEVKWSKFNIESVFK
jgi:hypothetical protein